MEENQICRVCLNSTDIIYNFMDLLSDSPHQVTILESFNICTHLEAYENDLYTQSLCKSCVDSLHTSFCFIIKAAESDRLLKEKYSNNLYQIENKRDDNELNEKKLNKNSIDTINVDEQINKEETLNNGKNIIQNIQNEDCNSAYEDRELTNDINISFTRKICKKNLICKQRLELEVNNPISIKSKRNYDCDICNKRLSNIFSLRNHMRIHTGAKPYICEECNQQFSFAFALTCHKRIHTGERPYKCEYCDKQFTQHTILKTHLTLHTGKTIECSLCDKKFSRKSNLILHQREHTGEKPYLCHICDKKYFQKCHLDRHLEVHAGIKFSCEQCNKVYSKKSSLNCHMYEHNGNKPFECSDCFHKFSRKDKYKCHLLKKHNKNVSSDKLVQDYKIIAER